MMLHEFILEWCRVIDFVSVDISRLAICRETEVFYSELWFFLEKKLIQKKFYQDLGAVL